MVVLDHVAEHAEDPEEFLDAVVREDRVGPVDVVGGTERPAHLVQLGLVHVLVGRRHLVREGGEHLEKKKKKYLLNFKTIKNRRKSCLYFLCKKSLKYLTA